VRLDREACRARKRPFLRRCLPEDARAPPLMWPSSHSTRSRPVSRSAERERERGREGERDRKYVCVSNVACTRAEKVVYHRDVVQANVVWLDGWSMRVLDAIQTHGRVILSSPEHEHMTCKMAVEHSCSGRNTGAAEGDGAQLRAPALFCVTVLDTAFLVPAGAKCGDFNRCQGAHAEISLGIRDWGFGLRSQILCLTRCSSLSLS